MVIGIDMGASAIKLAALEGDRIAAAHYERCRETDVPALCEKLGLDLMAGSPRANPGWSGWELKR